jgi:heat shock protein HtpX
MGISKRIILFVLTNIAVLLLISIIFSVFGIGDYISEDGIVLLPLLILSAIIGFGGAIISLLLSKWMAKFAYGVSIIKQPSHPVEKMLSDKVKSLAGKLKIGTPEIGIYNSPELNAFATGWNKNNSLVAVSTGLLESMDEDELEGVLGHEMAHVANGDMVTMALIQGVVNTFVVFFARIAAFAVSQFISDDEGEGFLDQLVYIAIVIVFQIFFGILASPIVMWFSRYREFHADKDSSALVGKEKMIKALRKLKSEYDHMKSKNTEPALATMQISNRSAFMELFSSHPPLEKRIKALEKV